MYFPNWVLQNNGFWSESNDSEPKSNEENREEIKFSKIGDGEEIRVLAIIFTLVLIFCYFLRFSPLLDSPFRCWCCRLWWCTIFQTHNHNKCHKISYLFGPLSSDGVGAMYWIQHFPSLLGSWPKLVRSAAERWNGHRVCLSFCEYRWSEGKLVFYI